jgi:hypothetical protein
MSVPLTRREREHYEIAKRFERATHHQSLRITPAIAGGVTTKLSSLNDIVLVIEDRQDLRLAS